MVAVLTFRFSSTRFPLAARGYSRQHLHASLPPHLSAHLSYVPGFRSHPDIPAHRTQPSPTSSARPRRCPRRLPNLPVLPQPTPILPTAVVAASPAEYLQPTKQQQHQWVHQRRIQPSEHQRLQHQRRRPPVLPPEHLVQPAAPLLQQQHQ